MKIQDIPVAETKGYRPDMYPEARDAYLAARLKAARAGCLWESVDPWQAFAWAWNDGRYHDEMTRLRETLAQPKPPWWRFW